MKAQIIEKLLLLKHQYGEMLFKENKRLMGFIKDYFPKAKYEQHLIRISLPLNLYEQFKQMTGKECMAFRDRQITFLEQTETITPDEAEEAVDLWLMLVRKEQKDEAFFQEKKWQEKLYNKGHAACNPEKLSLQAILHKASCYYNGEGLQQDKKEALKWYLEAARMGSVEAMNYAGNIYCMGDGVPKDIRKALKWYLQAASLGSSTAMNHIGNIYYEGLEGMKDDEKARNWYSQAIAKGNLTSVFNLGYACCEKALSKKLHSFEEGIQAAQKGNLEAVYYVAYCSHWGIGTIQDFKAAYHWYHQLAEKGEQAAMIWLAYMYFNGQGVKKSLEEARRWCEKAIKINRLSNLY